MNQTITLPRSAVEQALKALEADNSKLWPSEKRAAAITFLRERLEQPQVEQEPVAWIERWYGSGPERGWWIVCGRDHIAHLGPAEMSGEAASKIVSAHNTSPPAQRQPLTDEEITELADAHMEAFAQFVGAGEVWFEGEKEFARAIERAHGIGGEGMTKDDIIRMAREAKLPDPMVFYASIERFAALVAAAEREACAKVAEWEPCMTHTPQRIAAAIRARGKP